MDYTPQPWEMGPPRPVMPLRFPTGKRELVFAICIFLCGLCLCNGVLMGGFQLGFAIAAVCTLLCSTGYLIAAGRKLTFYSGSLLTFSLLIAAGFARADDGFVKFVLLQFLFVSANLGLCLLAGQNRRGSGVFASLADAFRGFFTMGFSLPPAFSGIVHKVRNGGPGVKTAGAILVGLCVAAPVLLIVVPLLISADAAFEGLLGLLPEFAFDEAIVTVLFGTGAACVFYTQGVALRHYPEPTPAKAMKGKQWNPLTINTVLIAVAVVYGVYLFSQLAYFIGGFSGILPEEFTLAQYARRGFFEMSWLCAINLGIIIGAVSLVKKQEGLVPVVTKVLCLFLGLVTLFLVATASGKMVLYINAFGLTRLRLLTELIILFFAIATVVISLLLFRPNLPYMKILLLAALCIGTVTIWADVDTVVASYNVSAYRSGKLEHIDLDYLEELGHGAIPQIARLTDDPNPDVARTAKEILEDAYIWEYDWRGWNYATAQAQEVVD